MAKKTKAATEVTTPANTGTATPTAPQGGDGHPAAQAAEERGKNDVFVRVMKDGKGVEPAKRLPPQAQVIVNAIEAAGPTGIKRADLITALTGKLVTRQPVGRIVSYYQKEIQNRGCVTVRTDVVAK